MSVPPRNVTPFLQWLRNVLLGFIDNSSIVQCSYGFSIISERKGEFKNALRFQDFIATRSPPPPNLPEGPSHKLSNNYYYTRDGRHAAHPPMILIEESQRKAITAGIKENAGVATVSTKKLGHILPGVPYEWQEASNQMSK